MPYDNSTMRSIYHTRKYDVSKLSQVRGHRAVLSFLQKNIKLPLFLVDSSGCLSLARLAEVYRKLW